MKKILVLIGFVLVSSMTWAQSENKEQLPPLSQREVDFRMAASLARYGYANRAAMPLIEAARICYENGFKKGDIHQVESGDNSAPNSALKNGRVSLDPQELLSDAKLLAENDPSMMQLIADIEEQSSTRGSINNGYFDEDVVNARSSVTYRITFRAGELAYAILSGDGDTDLDLYVYDSNGNLVTSDTDVIDDCVCRWYPKTTQRYRIVVKNLGYVYNRYVFSTN